VVDANRAYLARWMPWAQDDDLEKVQDFIRMSRRQFADNDGFSRKVPSPALTAAEAQRRGRAGFAVLGAGVTMLGVTVRMGESNPPGAALAPPEGRVSRRATSGQLPP